MNDIYLKRCKEYFKDRYSEYLDKLKEPCTQGFFINTKKADIDSILELIDFEIKESDLNSKCFYHYCDNIGKTKAYELGLIYPQEVAASLTASVVDTSNVKTVVDMCAAPGGKSINILSKLDENALLISNDVNHTRASILSSNIERMGFDNVIITNKKCDVLANQLQDFADLVILDAPCSGEGMIRKYPEILDSYSIDSINNLATTQKQLLEDAYKMLKGNGKLLYSTCTYAFEEDEQQISNFLKLHNDMHICDLGNEHSSMLPGTIKLSPLDNTEGQFICLMTKDSNDRNRKFKLLNESNNKIVKDFILKNININNYFLYEHNNHFYMSFIPLIDLENNVMKYGIYIGDIINRRFEPSHNLYRSNTLRDKFKNTYDLNDEEYEKYLSGYELKMNLKENGYYLITYKNYPLGFGKYSNGQMKNKYPKGLRKS